jgi:hypothetical protein
VPAPEPEPNAGQIGFSFPDDCGRNLALVDDCVSEIGIKPDGGLVLVLRRIDALGRGGLPVADGRRVGVAVDEGA